MFRKNIFLFILILMLMPAQAIANGSDEDAIRSLIAQYYIAFNDGNVVDMMKLYTENPVDLPPFADAQVGLDRIKKSAVEVHEQIDYSFIYDIKEIRISGNMAFAWFDVLGSMALKQTGQSVNDKGKMLYIFKKEDDGQWKIARTMFNPSTPLK